MNWSPSTAMTTELTRLLDANALLALYDPAHIHHSSAHRWFASIDDWATTAITEAAFLRLAANPKVMNDPVTTTEALTALSAMRSLPQHRQLPDDSSLAEPVIDLRSLLGHRQITDFHLVNLAAANAAILATFDAKLHRSLLPADRHHVELIPV